jgi:hypothetical protein
MYPLHFTYVQIAIQISKLARYPVKETKRKREELTNTKTSEPPVHYTILGPK